jgi:hypothetical protein
MEITSKERELLLELFNINESAYELELESWTDGGVDMFISIDKNSDNNLLEQLERFVENFDIDEEIDIHREDENYKRNFTIRESINDFENWVDYIEECISKLEEYNNKLEEYNNEDEEEVEYEPLETLIGVGVNDTEKGLKIILVGYNNNVLAEYEIEMNIKGYKEIELFNVCYEISKDIKDLYYSVGRIPTQEEVLNVVREVMVK